MTNKSLSGFDIVIAGSGPAGICAAISAAELGMRVLLLERNGIVGGNLTSGYITPIMGTVQASTMMYKITEALDGYYKVHDFEKAKLYLCELLDNAGAYVSLDTVVTGATVRKGKVTALSVNTRGGNSTVRAKLFIDCTGDGAVSALAGAAFDIGREEDGVCQPASVMFVISGCDPAQHMVCRSERDDTELPSGKYLDLCRTACAEGRLPPTVNLVRLYAGSAPDERMVNATQVNGVNGLDGHSLFKAQLALRRQIAQVVEFLRVTVPGFENIRVKSSSDSVGIRETRRIRGLHVLTAEQIAAQTRFPDTVAHDVKFPIDIHNPDGAGQGRFKNVPMHIKPYDIPYRCLVPEATDGLLVAGRCISGDHGAHASYRTMNICGTLGEAAGAAAALCVKNGVQPRELDADEIRAVLRSRGIELPDYTR